jgi:hypothetical protein
MAIVPSGTKFLGIDASVPTPELNGARINSKTEHYTIEDLANAAGVGAEGPQGVEGPAGPPGPVGPAGLEWQGTWDEDSSYDVDDAVGYDGASWFCIEAVTGTGNDAPDVDTDSWALLAAQGATGPQGAQGPTGPQGPPGASEVSKTSGLIEANNESPYQVLNNDLNSVLTSGASDKVVLPTTSNIGKEVLVFALNNGGTFTVRGNQSGTSVISSGGISSTSGSISVAPNVSYRFIHLGSGFWKAELI